MSASGHLLDIGLPVRDVRCWGAKRTSRRKAATSVFGPEPEFGEIDADLRGRIAAIERFTDGFPIAIVLSLAIGQLVLPN
jgi:hypothetical protein